jgi:CRISPR/Cas system Type II protein with McrA/HNH and RuvC-like nuclease domain
MIPQIVMDNKIKNKEANVIKVNERIVNGLYPKVVKYNGKIYLICVSCKHYLTQNRFTGRHRKCKTCRNNQSRSLRKAEFNVSMRERWRALKQRCDTHCTFEEFLEFANNDKCVFTGRTLKEDFEEPSKNILLRLEVDHIIPKSESKDASIENLQVVPRFWNRLKSTATANDCEEVIRCLRENVL